MIQAIHTLWPLIVAVLLVLSAWAVAGIVAVLVSSVLLQADPDWDSSGALVAIMLWPALVVVVLAGAVMGFVSMGIDAAVEWHHRRQLAKHYAANPFPDVPKQ